MSLYDDIGPQPQAAVPLPREFLPRNQIAPLSCRLGWHLWSKWWEERAYIDGRECHRCFKRQFVDKMHEAGR